MTRTRLLLAGLAGVALTLALVVPQPAAAQLPEAMPMAVGHSYILFDNWHEEVDAFEEKCGSGRLSIETDYREFTPIPRGKVTYVKPYNNKNDTAGGRFSWKCSSSLEHSECSNSPSGADFIRVYWSLDSRNISIRCFELCGDGSSAMDCN